jgi:hypothetical protein
VGKKARRNRSPVIDPTANVVALVHAGAQSAAELRTETNRRIDAELAHVKEMAGLRAAHQKDQDVAESARIDKIRQVDVQAAAATASQILTAVQTLAANSATQSTAIASQHAGTVSELNNRIAALERSSYVGLGKEKIADPQLERLSESVNRLLAFQSGSGGQVQGIAKSWGVMLAVIGVVFGIVGAVGTVVGIAVFFVSKK